MSGTGTSVLAADSTPAADFPATIAVLCAAARIPAAIARLGASAETEGAGTSVPQCHSLPQIDMGTEVLGGDTLAAHGVLGHELAHVALGHTVVRGVRCAAYTSILITLAAAWITAAAGFPFTSFFLVAWIPLLTAVLRHSSRSQEYAADARSVSLLDAAGLDGQACARAAIGPCCEKDPLWFRAGGWVLTGYPTSRSRLARLRASVTSTPDQETKENGDA